MLWPEANYSISTLLQLFNLISTCLGSPPTQFEFDYYDKNKKYCNIGPISPKQFYSEYVKPLCDLNDLVSARPNWVIKIPMLM